MLVSVSGGGGVAGEKCVVCVSRAGRVGRAGGGGALL